MKTIFVLGALWLSARPLSREVTLAFAPESGTTLRRTFEAHAELSLASLSRLEDGTEVESTDDVIDAGTEFTERIVVTDQIVEVEDGRPTKLQRTFDELGQETSDHQEDVEAQSEQTSDLAGSTVRFTWDADDESYSVEAAEGEEIDPELLERLTEDMDLRQILPEGDVEKGDEWEIPVEAYLYWMWPGGHLAFHAEGEEGEASGNDFYDQVLENLEGSGRARFLESREEDGRELAVVRVEFEVRTLFETEMEADPEQERPALTLRHEIERSVAGEVLWDVAAGHVHSAHLEADVSLVRAQSWDDEDSEGRSVEVERRATLAGTYEYTLTVECSE